MVRSQSPGRTARTRRRVVGVVVALAAVLAFAAVPALAAKPTQSSCWGNCMGDYSGGTLATKGDTVRDIADAQSCLGSQSLGGMKTPANVLVKGPLRLTKDDTFSYSGTVEIGLGINQPAHVTLSGSFTTSTLAAVTLTIHYKSCGTYHLRIKYEASGAPGRQ
jgi:hypothetical protein